MLRKGRAACILCLFFILGVTLGLGVSAQTQSSSGTFTRNLTIGSTGTDVSALQSLLIDRGFLSVANPTGYFGALTAVAVARWQATVGLPTTGYFGPLSRETIGANAIPLTVAAPPAATTTPAVTATASSYTRNLTIGDTGADVSALQSMLIGQGLLASPAPTGYFGPLTAAALAKWQSGEGLPATGYFGTLSRAAVTNTAPVAVATGSNAPPVEANIKKSATTISSPSTSTVPATTIVNTGGGNEGGGGGGGGSTGGGGGGGSTIPPVITPPTDTTPPTISITSPAASSTVTGKVNVSVNAADNVGVVKVELYVDGVLKATTTTTPYVFSLDTTLLTNAAHTLTAKAYDAAGNIGVAGAVGVTVVNVDTIAPSVPTGLSATAATISTISLSWTGATDNVGVSGYQIFRAGVQVATTSNTSYQDTGLASSTLYVYTVSAFDAAGNISAQSASVSWTTSSGGGADTTPPTISITSPAASSTVTGKVNVSVNAADNVGVVKVELYVDGVLKATTTTTPYVFSLDTTLLTNAAHTLTAKAYDAAGNIGVAGAVGVTVVAPSPTTPTGFAIGTVTTSTISLSWASSTESGGAIAGYKLYRGGVQVATSTVTSFTDTGLSANTAYSYNVASYDTTGITSASSSAVSTTTLQIPLNYNFGLSVGEDLMGLSGATLNTDLNDITSLGVGWLRFDIQWDHVQPNNSSSYTWTNIDSFVTAALAHHIKLLAILDYTPSWEATSSCTPYTDGCAPSNPADFATYAQAAAAHYTPMGVTNWEIWNEPNLVGTWGPAASATTYETFLKAGYTAIKSVNPGAFVISGGLAPAASANGSLAPVDFLTGLYAAGGQPYFDAVGDHPYSYPAMPSYVQVWNAWSQMGNTNVSLRDIMIANNDSSKKIWMTEYGAPTGGPGVLETSASDTLFTGSPDHVTEALQAQMMTSAITLAESYNWAGPLFWYSYKDLGTNTNSVENFFGIIRYDGSTKPSYQTFKTLLSGS